MKTYLVKKDINKPDAQDNWIIMNGYEFARFMETEDGQRRKKNFAKLDRCDERDDAIIVECGEKRAKEWERERLRELYRACANSKHPTISYDYHMPCKEAYCGDDFIADPAADIEEIVISNQELSYFEEALQLLTAGEKDLIMKLFLDEKILTEQQYADACGIYQSSAHERKVRTLFKLEKILKNFGFGADYFA